MMRPRDLFGVSVRVLAVWFWTQGAYFGYYALVKGMGAGIGNASVSPREDTAYMIFYVILGIVLMLGARALVWLAYGDAPKFDAAFPSN